MNYTIVKYYIFCSHINPMVLDGKLCLIYFALIEKLN